MTTIVKLAGGAQGFNWLPVFIAEEKGLFEKYGLKIEYMRMGSVDKATTAVREGEADLAITPPEGAVADYIKGGDLRILASNSNRLPMSRKSQPLQPLSKPSCYPPGLRRPGSIPASRKRREAGRRRRASKGCGPSDRPRSDPRCNMRWKSAVVSGISASLGPAILLQ